MKQTLYLAKYVLILFTPLVVCALLSSILSLNLEVFIPMIATTSVIFAGEIITAHRGESYMWKAISKSPRDKATFACCYILFWTIVELPIYLKMEIYWIVPAFIIGYLVAFVVFMLFASQTMKEEFPKNTRAKSWGR